MKNKKVCITGGAGFVGSNLVKRLKSEENEVTIVDDFSNGHMSFLSGIPNLTVLSMDFADPYVLNKITNKEFDIVYTEYRSNKPYIDEEGNSFQYIPASVFDNPEIIHNDKNMY